MDAPYGVRCIPDPGAAAWVIYIGGSSNEVARCFFVEMRWLLRRALETTDRRLVVRNEPQQI